MTDKELLSKINILYGVTKRNNLNELEEFKNELHAKITMYFLDNPSEKVELSRSRYRRLHDGGLHSWTPWDWVADVMVGKKMTRYIKWVD
ncbi:hypothetical protein [Limosilactobacillus reuteri]|uniref:hypothetical protein n=1 Tax=Limosilactobacillus reuteri TaxID=1598 RepID=UPI001C5B0398|nr:hypothetical protein [Limosilactobacillus reuteri]MBW3350686.1 hypothetical protein [Limosilactobacillus reuteri]UUW69582.1 hypothetical protein NUJ10_11125 [Limosilactobacillus reuteri]